MPTGNGAYVLHRTLSQNISGYTLQGYNPKLTFLPFLLRMQTPEFTPDIVHTTPDYGIFFQRKCPIVLTFHNYVLDEFMQQYTSSLQRIHYKTSLKWFVKRAVELPNVTLTAVSHFIAEVVASELNISQHIHVIHNGIDVDKFIPAGSFESSGRIKVLFGGNISFRKGVQWLDEIAEKVKNIADIYIATGLRGQSFGFKSPNIKFIGRVAIDDMPLLYNKMDILLFPTVREGFGLVAAEAMACGLPIVCSDCSSLPELVDNNYGGFRVAVGNTELFSDAIRELACNRELRHQFGFYNRQRIVESFPLEKMLNEYQQLFLKITSR